MGARKRLAVNATSLVLATCVLVGLAPAANAYRVVADASTPVLTANPTVELVDGVIRGALNITGAGSQQLRFQFLRSSKGGKLTMGTVVDVDPRVTAQSFTVLPYASWLDGNIRGTEWFVVRVTPMVKDGASGSAKPLDVTVEVNVGELAGERTPIAFTYKVSGYSGTPISVNFFPASGLGAGSTAPVILQASALGDPGNTNPYVEFDADGMSAGTAVLRASSATSGYNVITWDPRGSYASGGEYQLNDPFLDGVDVKRIISWAGEATPTALNGTGDPAVGMVGGSSGGEIQLVAAGIDPRIDAIAPSTTWSSLIDSLEPAGVLDTEVATGLLAGLTQPEMRPNPQLVAGLRSGLKTGRLSDRFLTMLANKDARTLLGQLQAPTLVWQSTRDRLFPLSQSMDTAQAILDNPYGTPLKAGWLDGDGKNKAEIDAVTSLTRAWMDKYVQGAPIPDSVIPTFQWWDQTGTPYTSDLLPLSPGFNGPEPIRAESSGGLLRVARDCANPAPGMVVKASIPPDAQIVGTPVVSFTYRGTGKARAICVYFSQGSTETPLGSLPSNPLPVLLDGKQRTISVPVGAMAFTGQSNSHITVTMWAVAPAAAKPSSVRIDVSEVQVDFPQRA